MSVRRELETTGKIFQLDPGCLGVKGRPKMERLFLMSPQNLHILEHYDRLPMSAVIPKAVAAILDGVSEKTVGRRYRTVQVSDNRVGVLKGDIEARRRITAAA